MNALTDKLTKTGYLHFAEGKSATETRAHIFSLLRADRYVPLYFIALFYLFIAMLLRLVLYASFGPPASVSHWQLPLIIGVGLVNDCIELLYLLAPFSLYLLLVPQRLYNSLFGRLLMSISLWLALFGMLYLAVVQFYFFQEFNSRFNLVAVDYLIYPHEVFVNIWESYPVARVLIYMAALSMLLMWSLWPELKKTMANGTAFSRRLKITGIHFLLLGGAITCLTTHTLDFSGNRVTNQITANGLSSFFEAFHTNTLDYNSYYITADKKQSAALLKNHLEKDGTGRFNNAGPGWIDRNFPGRTDGLGRLNVVVVVEESLGCEHVDACGKGLNIDASLSESRGLTPRLDQLARKGIFFNQAYATGTRTVRGLEAITASFPPIPGESIVKRPGSGHIATWGKVMRKNGYRTSFLYGGYGQFDNMNAYFGSNGFAVSDRLEIENPVFTNIWGVSDQDLFRHALQYYDREAGSGSPFFSVIMTTSNHSPYTFPSGIKHIPPEGGGRYAGVMYADYALGEFIRKAEDHSWFKNTLFVIVADHGARVYGKEQIPIASYEIPLLILSPGRLQPRQVKTPISQIDIAPTVLGLLGLPYEAPFFGRDMLAPNNPSPVLLFNHNHDVALYQDDKLVVLGLRKKINTYTYHPGGSTFESRKNDPGLTQLAAAYYQNAFNLFRTGNYQ